MEPIKNTIRVLMENLKTQKKKAKKGDPEQWLKKVLSTKELGHAQFGYFKNGVLNIKVDSSSWLYYLHLKKEALLARLSKKSDAIKDIHFRIGEMKWGRKHPK